jgi:O-antigen ligase
MTKRVYLNSIKALILLSPLPFGCVGRIWSPLFYLVVLILSFFGLKLTGEEETFLYEKRIRFCVYLVFAFIVFQLLPLPGFLLNVISPGTPGIIDVLKSSPSSFHPISVLPAETLGFGFRLFVLLFFFYVSVKIRLKQNEIFSLINVMIVSSVIQTIFGFLKLTQGNRLFYLFFYEDRCPDPHLTGTIANPDHFSFYLEMILPLAVAVLLARWLFIGPHASFREKLLSLLADKKAVFLSALPIFLIGTGIIFTGSGSGMIILLLSLFLLGSFTFYFSTSHHLRHNIRAVFTIIIILIIFMGLQNNLVNFWRSSTGNINYFTCWSNTIKLFSVFPLWGSGFGSYKYIYFLYDTEGVGWITHSHNDYLETFAEGGISGGVLFLLPIGWLLVSLYRMWLARRNPKVKAIGLGALVACFSVGFHSIFSFALRIPAISFLFVLIMVLGIKMVTYKLEAPHDAIPARRR